MNETAALQASLEAVLHGEILRMYQEVAGPPGAGVSFFHGREAAERFGYERDWLDRAPAAAVESFAGVGNPHERAHLRPGETVLDLGSGAGLDATIAAWAVGPTGKVIGVVTDPSDHTVPYKPNRTYGFALLKRWLPRWLMNQLPDSRHEQ